jgi:hypothetical protein
VAAASATPAPRRDHARSHRLNATDDEPVGVLRAHDFALLASSLQAVVNAPEKQRGGVYGTAQQIASFLTNREAMRWVTPNGPAGGGSSERGAASNPWLTNGAGGRRELDPHELVKTTATLYSLSKEGRGRPARSSRR